MDTNPSADIPLAALRALADFRFELRQFLQFSEAAATVVGLQPQQHQLLLQIAGAPEDTSPTISYVATRLGLRHNSAVELVDRSERDALLRRSEDPSDRRRVRLNLTSKGESVLAMLSGDHLRELHHLAPILVEDLHRISAQAERIVVRKKAGGPR